MTKQELIAALKDLPDDGKVFFTFTDHNHIEHHVNVRQIEIMALTGLKPVAFIHQDKVIKPSEWIIKTFDIVYWGQIE